MSFNKVILMGNLTADPETRTTPSGQSVTSFGLAVNRTWNDAQGNKQEATSFINCTAWGARGETIAKYVGKGRQLLVSGRLEQRSWDDKETGKKRSAIDVVVEEFSFVSDGRGGGSSEGGSNYSASRPSTSKSAPKKDVVIDDIPDEPIDLSEIPF
jgi:single-strand DNA-binding protein